MKTLNFNILQVLIVLLFSISCNVESSEQLNYNAPQENFNLISEGHGQLKTRIGDLLQVTLKFTNSKGESVITDSLNPHVITLIEPLFAYDLNYYLLKMNVGDSASFTLQADSVFNSLLQANMPANVTKGSYLTVYAKIHKTGDFTEPLKTKPLNQKNNIEFKTEIEKINSFMQEQGIDFASTPSGLRYHISKLGAGAYPKKGDEVQIKYTGKFLNGKVFDSSANNQFDFQIIIGRGDVVKGIEEGVTHLKKGGKGLLIIPSNLAFGKKGSGKLIPPNTPLLFEIELLKLVQN